MLEFAFSRRMCCSRVCRAMRSAVLPRASLDTPMMRPGHGALEALAGGEEGRVRAAEAHRHAEALRRAEGHVGAQLAGGVEQQQGQQVGGHRTPAPSGACSCSISGVRSTNLAAGVRVLQQGAEARRGCQLSSAPTVDQLDSRSSRRGSHHRRWSAGSWPRRRRTRSTSIFDTRLARVIASAAAVASSSSEALASSRPVRSMVSCWKFSSDFRRPWAISGLIGGVGGVPARVLQQVAQDHRGGDGCRGSPCRSGWSTAGSARRSP